MHRIITEIATILKDTPTLLEAEMELEILFQSVIQTLLSSAFKQIDQELIQGYKQQGYEIDSSCNRTIQFVFGNIRFQRHRMRKKGEKSVIPFDEAIGLKKRVRNSPLVEMKAAQMASDGAYRKAEEAIHLLTGFSLSHTTIHTITQKIGQTIQEWTEKKPLEEEATQKKKVPVLYIEGDGLLLSKGREEKRPELHRVQLHEGVEYKGKGKRPALKHSLLFESSVSSQEAFERASRWLKKIYDIRETIVVSNSDGGSGYEKEKFSQMIGKSARHEHIRDVYHVNEKIKQRLFFDKVMQQEIRKAIRLYDKELVYTVLTTAESRITDKEKAGEYTENVEKLKRYIERNWESLKPIQMRNLPTQNGIGICESNHRPYSYRLKRQGRGFSAKGAGNIAAILSARKNQTFLTALTETMPEITQEIGKDFKGAVRAVLKKQKIQPSIGVKYGKISNYSSSSSPIGRLAKVFR